MSTSTERGFSLVELAIVLVVAGIVMSFGLPAFSRYKDDLRLRQARQQLTEDIRTARQLAVTRRCPVYMRFGTPPTTTNIRTYAVLIDRNISGTFTTGERAWTRTLPTGTTLTSVSLGSVDTLGFDISGILIQPASGVTPGGTLVFRNARNRYDTLAVSTAGIVYRP
jgi:prepilin-type N-terminal cleavage/methylation domain-containing protein